MFNINTPMMNFVKQSELNLQHIKRDILFYIEQGEDVENASCLALEKNNIKNQRDLYGQLVSTDIKELESFLSQFNR